MSTTHAPSLRTGTAVPESDARSRAKPLLAVIAAVILVGLAALAVTLVREETAPATSFDRALTMVEGDPLDSLRDPTRDPAVGEAAPVIQGTDMNGDAVAAPAPGRPTILLFLAHWCPHCQAEVPQVQEWIDDGRLADEVDLVGVATATSSSRPNYPPSAWLDEEGWTLPTIGDASGAAATAYGVSDYPSWVVVDGDGTVVARRTGELTSAQMTRLATVAASAR